MEFLDSFTLSLWWWWRCQDLKGREEKGGNWISEYTYSIFQSGANGSWVNAEQNRFHTCISFRPWAAWILIWLSSNMIEGPWKSPGPVGSLIESANTTLILVPELESRSCELRHSCTVNAVQLLNDTCTPESAYQNSLISLLISIISFIT